jgi:hypothetical protein
MTVLGVNGEQMLNYLLLLQTKGGFAAPKDYLKF